MRFTVIWNPAALDDPMRIWADAPGRRADVSRAADEIERAIRQDPKRRAGPTMGIGS